jgi:hypothetical protein
MKLKLILTTATVGVALALASVSNGAAAAVPSATSAKATQPTLSLKKDCETFPGFNSVNITLAGLPPFTEFVGTLVAPGGNTFGPASLTTDASGSFELTIGTQDSGIFEATVVWSTGTLTKSLYVDCSTPASKEECKHGGWKQFGFKNQGQCIAFVNHRP